MGIETKQTGTDVTGEPEDTELIAAYRNGDADAFDILYGRYKRQLYAYVNRMMPGQQMQADDVFQQTWVRAIAKLDSYHDREMFLAWLMRIAHNLVIDTFRAGSRRAEDALDDAMPEAVENAVGTAQAPSKEMDRKELAEAIDRAVVKLPQDQREVFLLRQDDVSFKEISKIQKCSINTCLARMRYALNNLRTVLKDWAPTERR